MDKNWCDMCGTDSNVSWYYHDELDEVALCGKHAKAIKAELKGELQRLYA